MHKQPLKCYMQTLIVMIYYLKPSLLTKG